MSSRRDFRVADTRRARVILIEAGPRLLPALHPDSSARALQQLQDLRVEVLLGKPVTAVYADGVEAGGERLYSYNVIWAAGVRASADRRHAWSRARAGRSGEGAAGLLVAGAPACVRHRRCSLSGRSGHGSGAGCLAGGAADGTLRRPSSSSRTVQNGTPERASGISLQGLGLDGDHRQITRGGGDRPAALRRTARLVRVAAAAHTVLIGFRNRVAVFLSWIYSYLFLRRGSRLITGLTSEQIAALSADAIRRSAAAHRLPAPE